MNIITFGILCLLGVTTTYGLWGSKWIDYRLVQRGSLLSLREDPVDPELPAPTPSPTSTPKCKNPGRICHEDCSSVWSCTTNEGDASLIETCFTNQTCNNGFCSYTPNPQCTPAARQPFPCKVEGVFPDPADCRKYHYCVAPQQGGVPVDYSRPCPVDWGYHAGITYCTKKLIGNNCGAADYPVPICTKPGQNAPLTDNARMYYICSVYGNKGEVLYPYLHICPNGQLYKGDYVCK